VAKASRRAKERLDERAGSATAADLDATERRLREAVASANWDVVTIRDRRHAPSCLWRGGRPFLAETPGFIGAFLGWVSTASSRYATKTLIRAYLEKFNVGLVGFTEVATTLQATVGQWSWDWADRQREYAIFDPVKGPRALARAATAGGVTPLQAMAAFGLHGAPTAARFPAEAFRQHCERIARGAGGVPTLGVIETIIDWATAGGELRYPAHTAGLADAMLLPWTRAAVDGEVQKIVHNFLVGRMGDPRLTTKGWNGVSDPVRIAYRKARNVRAGEVVLGPPPIVRTSLLPVQSEGLEWLQRCWLSGLPGGALLADDMGLGKTLQALVFITWLQGLRTAPVSGGRPGPVLIVAPTGLLGNWKAEASTHLHDPGLGDLCAVYDRDLRALKLRKERDTWTGSPAST
jgi:hypothetical protein